MEHAGLIFDLIEREKMNVTFFEIVTMLALLWFREQSVDYAVLECGLGGRLDATNVVGQNIACAAITSIGLDHEEILGHSVEEIAEEKAGIIKPGVKGCVLGPSACQFDVFRRHYAETGAPPDNFVEVHGDCIRNLSNQTSYNRVNSEVSRRVLGIVLDKRPDELEALIPSQILLDAK